MKRCTLVSEVGHSGGRKVLEPNGPVTGSSVPNKSVRPRGNQSFDSRLGVVQSTVLIAVTFNRTEASLFDCGYGLVNSPGKRQIICFQNRLSVYRLPTVNFRVCRGPLLPAKYGLTVRQRTENRYKVTLLTFMACKSSNFCETESDYAEEKERALQGIVRAR
jgi:hypothetical protein